MVRTFAKKLRDKNERRGLRASKCFEIVTTQRQNTPTEEEVQTVIDILNDVLKEQVFVHVFFFRREGGAEGERAWHACVRACGCDCVCTCVCVCPCALYATSAACLNGHSR